MSRQGCAQGREIALRTLLKITEEGAFSNIALSRALSRAPDNCPHAEVALATEIVYGTMRWLSSLDYIIDSYSRYPSGSLTAPIRNILRSAIYQLYFMNAVPRYAAVDEAVKSAGRYGHVGTRRLVNAVLRALPEAIEDIEWPDSRKNPAEYLSVRYSHPGWLVDRWLGRYGYDASLEICTAGNQRPPLTIRVNRLKIVPDDMKERLRQAGYSSSPGKVLPEALVLQDGEGIWHTELYSEGLFQPQDEASMCVVKALAPHGGERVLDLCSAPGGKSTQAAEMMGDEGFILAVDLNAARLELLSKNAARLGIHIIHTLVMDARKLQSAYHDAPFDAVLVDAPCSGTGVLRRKPDIKWRMTPEKIKELSLLQAEIIDKAAEMVLPGGRLIYSVCSIEPEEGREIYDKFLQQHADFRPLDISERLPQALCGTSCSSLETRPGKWNMDGFFMGAAERKT